MTRAARTFVIVLGVSIPLACGLVAAWHVVRKPRSRPPSTETVESTPARVARGRYLANSVLACFRCHAISDTSRMGFPPKLASEGAGQLVPGDPALRLGPVVAPNITPDPTAGIGTWSDGEVMRALREGVSRDGRALSPVMPYTTYRMLSDEDTRSLVAYLRTLAPIAGTPERKLPGVSEAIRIATYPQPLTGPVADSPKEMRGRFLSTIAGCVDCHTPRDADGHPIVAKELTGGRVFDIPGGRVVSTNITTRPGTFVSGATRDQFVLRFRNIAKMAEVGGPAVGPGLNTPMPWAAHATMTTADLTSIVAYLASRPPAGDVVDARAPVK
jgi:cytochrome c553